MSLWLRFLLATLAVWRITHLLVLEHGPGEIMSRLRRRLEGGFWGRLLACFKCTSLWVAAPFVFFVGGSPVEKTVVWLALSGGAILLQERFGEPLILETEEDSDGLLRRSAENAGSEEPGSAD